MKFANFHQQAASTGRAQRSCKVLVLVCLTGLLCIPAFGQHAEFETLILADNWLCAISEHLALLRKLCMLDLRHNQFRQMPDIWAHLEGLTDFFYLHDNRLTSLLASFHHLTKLDVSWRLPAHQKTY